MLEPSIAPHRAYRRLDRPRTLWLWVVLGLIAVPFLILLALPWLNGVQHAGTQALLAWAGHAHRTASSTLLGHVLLGTEFQLAPQSPTRPLWMGLIALLLLAAMSFLKVLPLWLRQFVALMAAVLLVTAAALALLGGHRLAGSELAALATNTQALLWVIMPALAWLVAATTAASPALWALLPLAWLAYDLPLAVLRQAAWAALLARFGAEIAPLLYFFSGPLIDILGLVGCYGVMVYLNSRTKGLKWRWL